MFERHNALIASANSKGRELAKLTRDEKLAVLNEGLNWNNEGGDWILEIHHILTEPVCPTANIRQEMKHTTKYMVHADTLDEAIDQCIDLAYRGEILKEPVRGNTPWTNPDDYPDGRMPPIETLA